MHDVNLKLNENGNGAFFIMDGAEQVGEMVIQVSGQNLTVYHTEVDAKVEGKGLAKMMLSHMENYARENKLQVIPLCPYVYAQFKRHPEEYSDIWNRRGTNSAHSK